MNTPPPKKICKKSVQNETNVCNIPLPHIPVAGRLKYFIAQWQTLTNDSEVLDMVHGMHIDLIDKPEQNKCPFPIPFSQQETAFMDQHVGELLAKGVIKPSFHKPGEFVSTVF